MSEIQILPPIEAPEQEMRQQEFQRVEMVTHLIPVELVTEGELDPHISGEVLLGSLGDGRFRVQEPIRVRLSTEGQSVIAEAVDFNEFGYGESPSEAISNLQQALVELYSALERDAESLGKDLATVWSTLHGAVTKKHA